MDRFLESGRLVFATLGKLGLHDAIPAAQRRYSIPTDLISLNKISAIRIDHVLANDRIAVVHGGRGTGKTTFIQHLLANRRYDQALVHIDARRARGFSGSWLAVLFVPVVL